MLQSQIAIAGKHRKKRPVRHSSFGRNVRVKFCEAGALYWIVLDWIKAASRREKSFSRKTGQICGFLPKPHARGKQSFLFCPGALIWCISHTHGGRLAEMTPQNRDSCSTTHKGADSQNGNLVKTALTRPAIQEHVKAIGLFCPIGGRVRGEAIQKLRGILSLSVPHTRAGEAARTNDSLGRHRIWFPHTRAGI